MEQRLLHKLTATREGSQNYASLQQRPHVFQLLSFLQSFNFPPKVRSQCTQFFRHKIRPCQRITSAFTTPRVSPLTIPSYSRVLESNLDSETNYLDSFRGFPQLLRQYQDSRPTSLHYSYYRFLPYPFQFTIRVLMY